MKKQLVFLFIALFVLNFFACELQMPKEILIKGNPQLRLSAEADFSKMFSDMITDGFGEGEGNAVKMLHCIKVHYVQTYLVHMIAIEQEFMLEMSGTNITVDGGSGFSITEGTNDITLNVAVPLFDSNAPGNNDEPIKLPFSNFSNSDDTGGMTGFEFKDNVKGNLYFSGSDIINKTNVKIDFVPDGGTLINVKNGTPTLAGSNVNPNDETFSGTVLPSGGHSIPNFHIRLNEGKDITTQIAITLPANTQIPKELLGTNLKILVELLIWMPLEFVTVQNDATIDFPDDFFGEVGSFISSLADSEAVDWLTLDLQLQGRNPFEEGHLVMSDTANGITIVNPLTSNSLRFEFDKNDLKTIYDAGDFSPELFIRFDIDETITIPKEFKTAMVVLNAGINYLIEL